MTLVLASSSPRRAALLAAAGFHFEVRVADVDETPRAGETAAALVERLAPLGKAGAYGIQGLASRFVTRVDGSYPNVVGLPIAQVARRLAKFVQTAS